MNGEARLKASRRPLARPTAAPMSSVMPTAGAMLPARPSISTAATTALSEITAPTERSTPPMIITRVTPTAAMPAGAAWRTMLNR